MPFLRIPHLRFLFSCIVLCICGIIPTLYAEGAWGRCALDSGLGTSLKAYRAYMESELSTLSQSAQWSSCENGASQSASSVIGSAWAQISLFSIRVTDFQYQMTLAAEWGGKQAVVRDGKIFDLIDKKIGNTAEKLAQKCALDAKARTTLSRLIQENQIFSQTFKQTALGHPPAIMHGIQESERHIWEGITKEYTPLATQGCSPKNKEIHKKTGERLKNITDIWGKLEKALASWRKAIAIFRGEAGTSGNRPTDYVALQRRLLQRELSRQGLSKNSKQVILQNFDCFKANTSDTSQISDLIEARIKCLSNPLLGIDRLFLGWQKKIAEAPTSDHRLEAQKSMDIRMSRTVDVPHMYHTLRPMIATEIDINAGTLKSLIDTHIDLTTTNEMLEKRIKPMQNNCMRGSPDIVGGCRE